MSRPKTNIEITFSYLKNEKPKTKKLKLKKDEEPFYKELGVLMSELTAPNTIDIHTEDGESARYLLIKRSGAFFIKEDFNHISLNKPTQYATKYLTCVDDKENHYKFYQLEQQGDQVVATYGRIGAEQGDFGLKKTYTYPLRMFWIKYFEKINKGYKDLSDVYVSNQSFLMQDTIDATSEDYSVVTKASMDLYTMLKGHAKLLVEKTLISTSITYEMVVRAKEKLALMREYAISKDINSFNETLKDLMSVSPRRVATVKFLMAQSPDDFPKIIDREEILISAMEALVQNKPIPKANKKTKAPVNSFENMGIEVYDATDEQKKQVLKNLSPELKPKVDKIFRVINQEHQKRFNEYLKKNHIKKVKQLWHGSRNENWFSIITNGLVLNPNAIITGKMFGKGIYFAPSSNKSWNYTSYHGTHWAHGTESVAYMGLYATAYGDPLDVYQAGQYTQGILNKEHKNCVHAHAGVALRNDEIIFYNEAALILNYIVVFK